MHMQTAPLPVHFQMLCESSKLYDPGQQYASYVRQLQRGEEPDVHYDFEPHISTNAWYHSICTPETQASHPQGWVQGSKPACHDPSFLSVPHQVPSPAYPEKQLQC
jgi:hypothetical protein